MWQIKKNIDGVQIEDEAGQVIATLAKPADAVDDSFQYAKLMAAAPAMLKICQGEKGRPLVENLRQLAQTLERLTQGPIKAPLDQQMHITNELCAWRDYLRQVAGEIEAVLGKIEQE